MLGNWSPWGKAGQADHLQHVDDLQPKTTPILTSASSSPYYPVGNTTIEIYLRHLLERPVTLPDGGFPSLLQTDIVAATVYLARTDSATTVPPWACFVPILTRCITSTYDLVCFADECMVEIDNVSVLSGLLLQILVAVCLKHRNLDMLPLLLKNTGPPTTMFMADHALFPSVLDDPNYGRKAWALLSEAGWAAPLPAVPFHTIKQPLPDIDECYNLIHDAVRHGDGHSAVAVLDDLVARGFVPIPYTFRILHMLVAKSSADMVVRFFALVARTGPGGYDGIPPHAKWPGGESFVALAASRADPQGTGVLKAVVEIGGMDVHTCSGIGYKAGPNDSHPMALSGAVEFRLLPDGSYSDDPPLLAAVHHGNVDSVAYLLGLLEISRKYTSDDNNILEQAVERAKQIGRQDVLQLLEAAASGTPHI